MENLPRETQSLEQFLNTTLKPRNPQVLRQRLSHFLQLLRLTNSSVTLNVTIRSFSCLLCQAKVTSAHQFLRLKCQCEGTVCGKECFRAYVYQYTGGTLQGLDLVPCPRCYSAIEKAQVVYYFTEFELITNWQRQSMPAVPRAQVNYHCGIHDDDFGERELAPMGCFALHQYCKDCMQGWIATKINDGQADVGCPKKDCTESVPQTLVRELCPELFQRYLTLLVNGTVPKLGSDTEIVFDCPTPDCPNRILVDKRIMDFTCTECQKRYCPQCKCPVHVPETCKQYFDRLQAELKLHLDQLHMDEAATEAYFKANGIKPCPKCNVPIHKISGCKYVTCMSGVCQGTTYLCMDCGKQLPGDHANHPCP